MPLVVKKLINSMHETLNLERLLYESKFMSVKQQFQVTFRNNHLYCPYLLKVSPYLFKRVTKAFFLKNNFNCKSRKVAKKSILARLVVWSKRE